MTDDLTQLSEGEFQDLLGELALEQEADRKENQLIYYQPVSETAAKMHESTATYVGIGGGNGSSKTESALVEIIALATGVFPESQRDVFRKKFRGPIMCRIIVESLINVLIPIILPKLMWWKWTGVGSQGSDKGHWGWVPKNCLKDGKWDKSWHAQNRLLTLLCRDPDDPSIVLGESVIQFNSHDQDATDFASGDFHVVMSDEPTKYAIWLENQARTMRVNGRMFMVMTWPDDPAIPVDWIFDELYEKGVPGPNKSPDHDWFVFDTRENEHLDQGSIAKQMENWSEDVRKVRIEGGTIRFSNRIHPLFTDKQDAWCFRCGRTVFLHDSKCRCGSEEVTPLCHVVTFDHSQIWPVIFCIDPHPRKPHMFAWVQVTPEDDLMMVAEGEIDGDPGDLKKMVDQIENEMGLNVQLRLMDPNMGRSPASAQRNITWQDEFDTAKLFCELADPSEVGRMRVNEYLKPDPHTYRPRLVFHPRCKNAIYQMKRYTWADFKKTLEKDQKQKPREKYDDYPAILRYVMNSDPDFSGLHMGAPVIRRLGTRQGAY